MAYAQEFLNIGEKDHVVYLDEFGYNIDSKVEHQLAKECVEKQCQENATWCDYFIIGLLR